MVPLIGYVDRFSARPGERIAVKVSSQLDRLYRADLVRIIHDDVNPAGPCIKLEDVPAAFAGTYLSRFQPVHLGSCGVVVPVNPIALPESCAIVVRVQPWLLDGRPQTVLAIEGAPALFVSAEGARLELGDRRVQLSAPILKGRWYELRVIAGNEHGGYGCLWRRNSRAPQLLCGAGFSAQGLFEGSYYRRMPGAADPRAAWILDGIDGEVIGDFGLSGGGAAGFELDRADFALGTPPNALILARSEGHQSHFGTVLEELLCHLATLNGERPKDLIRAESSISRRQQVVRCSRPA